MLASSLWTLVFAATLIGSLLVKFWLATRQMRHVAAHRDAVPAAFAGSVSLAAHRKAADYTLARGRFGLLTMAFGAAVLLGWTLLGGLDALNAALRDALQPSLPGAWGDMAYQLALLAAFALIGGALDLPFEWYRVFRIEQRFGFNRMNLRLWIIDGLKGIAVGALIGLPLAALVLWLMGAAGTWWWLWAWGVWTAFQLLMLVLYPTLIAPLFNKFEPLADEPWKQRVQALMQRCGFAAKGLFVMDGSRRSAHGNAYFTGLGAAKRVVFFDTLLAKLNAGEVEAVLAHELGHFKRRHVTKRMRADVGAQPGRLRAARLAVVAGRGSTPGSASSRTSTRATTRWRCCCSCSRCRCSASSSRRWRRCCRAATSSKPTPTPAPTPAAAISPPRWSSCTRTTRPR